MKPLGFSILLAGWIIVCASFTLLVPGGARVAFLVSGVCVEIMGLGLVVRSHIAPRRVRR